MALLPILGAASLLGSLIAGSKKVKTPKIPDIDISGELAKLDELYNQQRELNKQILQSQLSQARKNLATSLAARGIYSSPVSQSAYNQLEGSYQTSLADMLASLAGKQAETRASLTSQLVNAKRQADLMKAQMKYEQDMQKRKSLSSLLGLLGGSLLSPYLTKLQTNTPTTLSTYTPNYPIYNPSSLSLFDLSKSGIKDMYENIF